MAMTLFFEDWTWDIDIPTTEEMKGIRKLADTVSKRIFMFRPPHSHDYVVSKVVFFFIRYIAYSIIGT